MVVTCQVNQIDANGTVNSAIAVQVRSVKCPFYGGLWRGAGGAVTCLVNTLFGSARFPVDFRETKKSTSSRIKR